MTSVKGAVNEATQTRAVEWIARAGYPVNGILHLLIAYLIVRIALGFGGDADQTGALATLANSGGGLCRCGSLPADSSHWRCGGSQKRC